MVIDKKRLDRRKVLVEDRERHRLMQLIRQIQAELHEGESLGEPFRAGVGVIIPIETRPAAEEESKGR